MVAGRCPGHHGRDRSLADKREAGKKTCHSQTLMVKKKTAVLEVNYHRQRRTRICLNAQFHLLKLISTTKPVFVIWMTIGPVELMSQYVG
jgi:hypothetical protein